MRKKKKTHFLESAELNNRTYWQYYNRLTELAMSTFEWKNVPPSIDKRFLEMTLFSDGYAIFFKDEVLDFVGLQCMIGGKLNVYRIPMERTAYSTNGYQKRLTEENSVIVYNNLIRTNSLLDVEMFATRLYNIDRTIDVNVNAQKTPILIQCDEKQRLTFKNLFKEYDGNAPVIYGSKGIDTKGITVLKTDAPYQADKLQELKVQIWNEALTYLGISNINIQKKERMVTDEVIRNQGGTIASRYSRLEARREACEVINNMFGLDIWVDYREDLDTSLKINKESEEETYE